MFELTTRKSSDILEADWEMENGKCEMGNGDGK